MTAPIICWGLLQVDRLGSRSGKLCSTNLTQPGQQEVNMGSLPPFLMRSTSSVPSSMMVRSAAKSVSKTCLKPMRRRAAASLPVTLAPGASPKNSPRETRMAGAAWATRTFLPSCMVPMTRSMSETSCSAPIGQASTHWPQFTQEVSLRSFVEGRQHHGVEAAAGEVDGRHPLDLLAHPHAAAAEDALVRVAHDRGGGEVGVVVAGLALEGHLLDVVLRRQALQLAVQVAVAGQAVEGVAGQQQLDDGLAGVQDPRAAGVTPSGPASAG